MIDCRQMTAGAPSGALDAVLNAHPDEVFSGGEWVRAEGGALANDCEHGLHGAVFTSNPEPGLEVASAFQSGSVAVNACGLTPATPCGGVEGSGVGREHGREGVAAFLEYRSFVIPGDLAATLERRDVPVA
jgi:hypothetical protein